MGLSEARPVPATQADGRCELHFLATSERWTDSVLRVESLCKNRLILYVISTGKVNPEESIPREPSVKIQCRRGTKVTEDLS